MASSWLRGLRLQARLDQRVRGGKNQAIVRILGKGAKPFVRARWTKQGVLALARYIGDKAAIIRWSH